MIRTILNRIAIPAAAASFALLLLLERRRPLRHETGPKLRRVVTNLDIAAVTGVVVQILFLPLIVRAARLVESRRAGLLMQLPLPSPVRTALAVLLLDYTYYWWHLMLHRVSLLWRFHLVHHIDGDLDVSTAVRFHFGEWILSTPFRAVQVIALGADARAVSIFESCMILSILFHHSNTRLPIAFERALNLLLVTPRMHGIHHSIVTTETHSNFSTMLSVWDRLHRTLRLDVPQEEITIGLPEYPDAHRLPFTELLTLPFAPQRPPIRIERGVISEQELMRRLRP